MGNRLKKMKSWALDPDLLEELEAWRMSQAIPPATTQIVEAALRMFLKHQAPATKPDARQASTRKK